MQVSEFIQSDRVLCDVEASSKKRAFEALSQLISKNCEGISANDVFDSLIAREKLGGTGLGYGVAIPHGRLKNINSTRGAFIKLKSGIDFDAIDKKPVDLMFALLVPENAEKEHLQTLALLANMLNDENLRENLRHATTADQVQSTLSNWQDSH